MRSVVVSSVIYLLLFTLPFIVVNFFVSRQEIAERNRTTFSDISVVLLVLAGRTDVSGWRALRARLHPASSSAIRMAALVFRELL